MSKKTLYILGIILTAIFGAILQYFLCCNCSVAKPEPVAPVVETPAVVEPEIPKATKNGLAFIDPQGGLKFSTNDNFNFNASNFSILTPLSTKVDEGVSELKAFFEENPSKVVTIVGHYKGSEENPSAFPNLGIARANAVKNHLVGAGISSKQINLDSKLNDDLIADENIHYGPVNFEITTDEVDHTDELAALKAEIIANPLILYFDTNSSNVSLTAEQRAKLQKIATYIDKVDDSKASVIGHTDSKGNVASNIKLGRSRANTISAYLQRNGINKDAIDVSSQGPKKPIATNKTEAGRAKNRRVEVTLK